ncbi:MAG: WbqC family protein [Thalassospira sp.]|uniref:WbqC family protein n=1 Tax=Thalassospira sp. TaxID=1912094 RepID=UPI0032ED7A43
MLVAIMQPTYLPWIGYLAMIDKVDQFVFLDSVAFNSRSWQQRNYIRVADSKQYLSVPVATKGQRGQLINDVKISSDAGFPTKHIRSIEANYRKCQFYDRYAQGLFDCFYGADGSLNALNISIIRWLCEVMGIDTPIAISSTLDVRGQKAELLANICEVFGAEHYLSAPGSRAYIEESSAFDKRGINVEYHDYNHPEYPQCGKNFIPYMAAIDLLFNVGGVKGLQVIRSGIKV